MPKLIDLTGQRFGRLTVLERAENKRGHAAWLCRCDCGRSIVVQSDSLKSGNTRSCGCLFAETSLRKIAALHKDHDRRTKTRLYNIWHGMRKRCKVVSHNSFRYYGERGISVCPEWETSFDAFRDWAIKNGYSDNLSIDRINNNLGYSPTNCRWVDGKMQGRNKRNNKRYFYRGENLTAAEWADQQGLDVRILRSRLNSGWPIERALTEPLHTEFSHKKE